jgi:lipid A disaccharide synthetase
MIDMTDILDCFEPSEPEPYDPAKALAVAATQIGHALIERGVIKRRNRKWEINQQTKGAGQ